MGRIGYQHTPEAIAKIAAAGCRPITASTRAKIARSLTGVRHPRSRVDKMRASKRAKYPGIKTGDMFGCWLVIGEPISQHNQLKHLCRCTCGTESYVAATHLRRGNSKQCEKCVGRANVERAKLRNRSPRGRWLYTKASRSIWFRAAIEEFLYSQKYHCPICMRRFADRKEMCVDHDHETNEIRGVVHRGCNVLIGWFDRHPDMAVRIEQYLEAAR